MCFGLPLFASCVRASLRVMSGEEAHQKSMADSAWLEELQLPQVLISERVRSLHATIEQEWDYLRRSACQTAAGRALWNHVIRDPLAAVLAGESYLRSLYEKMRQDRLSNAREVSGVILAVRTLWFDSRIEAAINSFGDRGAHQVVLLGAGQWFLFLPLSICWLRDQCLKPSLPQAWMRELTASAASRKALYSKWTSLSSCRSRFPSSRK